MNAATDTELVARLSRGDKPAFSELMSRHGPAVYRYAWALADESGQVDDLMQDTFLVLWKRRRAVSLVGESLLPWLLTTCRFTAFNSNRSSRLRLTVPLDVGDRSDPAGSLSESPALARASEELAWVRDEIAALSPLDRQLVERCLIQGESYTEAAAALGISAAAARKRIQRTRSRLAAARSDNS